MKKRIQVFLCAVLCLPLAGCSFVRQGLVTAWETAGSEPPASSASAPVSSAPASSQTDQNTYKELSPPSVSGLPEPLTLQEGLESLPMPALKRCYQGLLTAARSIREQPDNDGLYMTEPVMVDAQLEELEIRRVIDALQFDHPEIFWINGSYRYTYFGGGTTIELYSPVSPSVCAQAEARLLQKVWELLAMVPEGLDAFDRELFLHDVLMDLCVYDDEAVASGDSNAHWSAYTPYGALVEGVAVCEGYAEAFQLLLCYAGVYCRTVNGEAGGEAHMWNLVRLDGDWYHVDPTWNDSEDMPRYDYFNVTDAVIQTDHQASPGYGDGDKPDDGALYNLPLPSCTAEKDNYYVRKAPLFSGPGQNMDAIVQALAEAVRNREAVFSLRIAPGLSYDEALVQLFEAPHYYYFDFVDAVNAGSPSGPLLDAESVYYTDSPSQNVVTVELSYLAAQSQTPAA
jgi:hypothetical protein